MQVGVHPARRGDDRARQRGRQRDVVGDGASDQKVVLHDADPPPHLQGDLLRSRPSKDAAAGRVVEPRQSGDRVFPAPVAPTSAWVIPG
jgi:hypothetical protein